MLEFLQTTSGLAWPLALAIAWVAGEFGHRWTGLPRISLYGIVGFLLASPQTGFLPPAENGSFALFANIALGLILFELGYRINLRWLRNNPWIGATGLLQAALTFAAVYAVAVWFEVPTLAALMLASLAMVTSPAGVLRVVNEQSSSGQVTERVMHLAAIDSVLTVFAFKVIVGLGMFQTSGNLLDAAWNSFAVLLVSAAIGGVFGMAVPALLRRLGNLAHDATVGFAIAVILLVALTYTLKLSPVLATLTFGLTARHRRVALSRTERNFGVVGDLLTILLFVYVSATLDWRMMLQGVTIALALLVTRFVTKIIGSTVFARASGISWRKGVLTGVGLAPMSVLSILLVEQSARLGVILAIHLAPLAAMVLVLGVVGPVLTQRALVWARETPDTMEN